MPYLETASFPGTYPAFVVFVRAWETLGARLIWKSRIYIAFNCYKSPVALFLFGGLQIVDS